MDVSSVKESNSKHNKNEDEDNSSLEKDKLPLGDGHVFETKDAKKVETSISKSSSLHSTGNRVDFWLKRVKSPIQTGRNHVTQTNDGHHVGAVSSMDPEHDVSRDVPDSQTDHVISEVKDKTPPFVASPGKSTISNFVEYWVPVKLSDIQIEQYCGFLFSNSGLLCSEFKPDFDSSAILQDMLISTRKTCDHPYLVDRSLRTSVIQDIPEPDQLNAEIQLSSKLHLLHKILMEIKQRGLRTLILYQSLGGSGLISAGDILDDILHEKFGGDSFVRIHGGISRKKKQNLKKIFNDKESGVFACLMETRDCLPSVKLSSIDIVIFFNSDWDPMNDLKALRRINLHSRFDQVKVFRFYSSHTVEEKVLILSKLGMPLECNLINIKQNTCHGLLAWGTPYLFGKLDEFHKSNTQDIKSIISFGGSFVDDVFNELLSLLPNNGESNGCTKCSLILEVQLIGSIYPKNISLLGEVESPLIDGFSLVEEMVENDPSCVVWINLIRGRKPRWKFLSNEPQRARRRIRHVDFQLEGSPAKSNASKKCRNEIKSTDYHIPTIFKRRVRDQLPIQTRKRKRSVRPGGGKYFRLPQKVKSINVECGERIASQIAKQNRANTLRRRRKKQTANIPSSVEPQVSQAKNHLFSPVQLIPTSCDRVPESRMVQNGNAHCRTSPSSENQAATREPAEDSARPSKSSLPHSTGHVPLQSLHLQEPSSDTQIPAADSFQPPESSELPSVTSIPEVPITFGSCQPLDAGQGKHSETLKSVCLSLQIELEMIAKEKNRISEQHENMKLQSRMAYQKEIEQVDKKYNLLLQNSEMAFVKEKEILETRYSRVDTNRRLAEVMMLRDDPKYRATADHLIEEICQRILLHDGLARENQPMSFVSPSAFPSTSLGAASSHRMNTQPSASPCKIVARPASSMAEKHSLSDQQSPPGFDRTDPHKEIVGLSKSSAESAPKSPYPQSLLGFSNTKPCSTHNPPFTCLESHQAGYNVRMRAPAPHLRRMIPLHNTATEFFSGLGTLSPVETQDALYKLQAKQSPPSEVVGLPAFCHGN